MQRDVSAEYEGLSSGGELGFSLFASDSGPYLGVVKMKETGYKWLGMWETIVKFYRPYNEVTGCALGYRKMRC